MKRDGGQGVKGGEERNGSRRGVIPRETCSLYGFVAIEENEIREMLVRLSVVVFARVFYHDG